uniref:Uncharacterized protein n=1 Tax=Falco tinnunculus TaxID=100819 RepID=A0A8C4U0Q5_FALTI
MGAGVGVPGQGPGADAGSPAVVGAGVGGAAAAHFLRQRFGRGARLAVLERAAPGGRVATVRLEGAGYEAGGAVLHPLNLHMKRFVSDL